MKAFQISTTILVGVQCLALSIPGLADTTEFEFSAKGGLEHDSNLSVRELDQVSDKADIAKRVNARLGGRFTPSDKLTLKGSYSYASKNYRQYDEFDQRVHTWSGDASYDFSLLTLGTSMHKAKADLATERFLDLNQRSIYAGKLFDNRVYLRAAVNRSEKNFAHSRDRDTRGRSVDADLFVFFNDADSFWSFGIVREQEDANSPIFDNQSLGFRSRFSNKFLMLGKDNKFELAWRYVSRDYSGFNPLLGSSRYDIRRTTEASWEIAFNPTISAITKVEHGHHNSNLAAANYNETLGSFSLSASF